jgi:2-polyprenyl-3-methyl-5-hydroxy-6-metoxy-1,4-benzoquinol methylase
MQVYIDGLSDGMTERDIFPFFSGIDSLVSVRVIRDIVTGKSRGFALAMISNNTEGQSVIQKLNGASLKGRKLTVFKIHDTLTGEMEFREWFRDNSVEVLHKVGILESHTVADYGCGPGIFSFAAAEIVGPQGKVYALDVRLQALEKIKGIAIENRLNNLETILIDRSILSVSLKKESVDVVLLYDVLQEIVDKPGLMAELHKILKPSGILSVFPMHLGTDKFLDLVKTVDLFHMRDSIGFPGFESASNVVNLTKRKL